jgi:hypothetical protein
VLVALLPLLGPLLTGASLPAAVGAVSLTQWITLGGAVLSAAPGDLEALQALGGGLGPFLADLFAHTKAAGTPHGASASATLWLARNGEGAIAAAVARDAQH